MAGRSDCTLADQPRKIQSPSESCIAYSLPIWLRRVHAVVVSSMLFSQLALIPFGMRCGAFATRALLAVHEIDALPLDSVRIMLDSCFAHLLTN